VSAALLQAEELTLQIGERLLCDRLDLAIHPGECWAILGKNGAGKTTLLHTLAGIHPLQHGRVTLRQQPIQQLSRRQVAQQLGLLLQQHQAAFPGTVLEHALMGRHPHQSHWGALTGRDHQIVQQALKDCDLMGFEQRQVSTLSGGEQQRLAFATLFSQRPQILLLDEPNNHLDLHHQIALLEQLCQQARNEGQAVVMILHDINLALRFCDRVLLMFDGGETLGGSRQSVISSHTLSRLYGHQVEGHDTPQGAIYLPA